VTYGTPKCPECGETLMGECDMIPSCARVTERPDGGFDYEGDTEVFWDGQVNRNAYDRSVLIAERFVLADTEDEMPAHLRLVSVQCAFGHEWNTTKEDA
jgi:hypothetical protein